MKELTKMAKTKTKKNDFSLGKILNSPYSIIVVLILFAIALLFYTRYLIRCNVIYSYSGYTKDFSFFGGVIYDGPIVNYFGDSKVLYKGEDVLLYDYEVGFYIKYDEKYSPISVTKGYAVDEEDEGDEKKFASMKEIVAGTSFSFTETDKDAVFLSKENVDNLENLVFKISGKNKKGDEVKIEIPMMIEKVTK